MGLFHSSDPLNEDIKEKIEKEMKDLYDKNYCSNIKELENHLDINKLSKDIQDNIKKNDKAKKYYNETKENYIRDFIKKRISKEIQHNYDINYHCWNINELKNHLDINKLSKDIQDYINKYYEIQKYYKETKEYYINKFKEKENKLSSLEDQNRKSFKEQINHNPKIYKMQMKTEKYKREIKEKEDKLISAEKRYKKLINEQTKYIDETKKMKLETEQYKRDLKEQEDKLKEISKKNAEIIKKKNKEINDTIKKSLNKLKEMEEEIKKKGEQEKIQYEEEKKKLNIIFEKKLEDLKKQHEIEMIKQKKEELLKEEQKLIELNSKKEKLNKIFDKRVNRMKRIIINKIYDELEKKEKDFCINEISEFWDKNILDMIENLFESEDLFTPIIYQLKSCIKQYRLRLKNIEHLNIILVGPCGVGKTTLINEMLNVNGKTNFGRPETKKIEFYSSENIPFLRLVDSRGIEKDNNIGIDSIFKSIQKFIKEQISTNDPDKFIHCIWYCWTGTRLEESEKKLFEKLSQEYSLKTIPIIIVYTNAISDEDIQKAKDYVLNDLKCDYDFVEVLAKKKVLKDNITIQPFNLDKLREVSIQRAKSAIESSCYEGLLEEIKKQIRETLEKLIKILKEKINQDVWNIISNINETIKIKDLHTAINDIIINILYQFFFLKPDVKITKKGKESYAELFDLKYSISEITKCNIEDFVVKYFEEIVNIYQKNLDEINEKYSKDLAKEILIFQNDFNQENDNLLDIKWTFSKLQIIQKDYINEAIKKKVEIIAFKNSISFISTRLIEQFGEFFSQTYIEGMKLDEFKEASNEAVKLSFDKIEEKIQEYNQMINKQKEEKEKENNKENKSEEPAPTYSNKNNETNVKNKVSNIIGKYKKNNLTKEDKDINKEIEIKKEEKLEVEEEKSKNIESKEQINVEKNDKTQSEEISKNGSEIKLCSENNNNYKNKDEIAQNKDKDDIVTQEEKEKINNNNRRIYRKRRFYNNN